jgi:hypothetical protein
VADGSRCEIDGLSDLELVFSHSFLLHSNYAAALASRAAWTQQYSSEFLLCLKKSYIRSGWRLAAL